MKSRLWLLGGTVTLATCGALFFSLAGPGRGTPALAADGAHAVDPTYAFGMQFVPKFDEHKGRGAWEGTRTRGIAFHKDLGVEVSREGFLWRHFEPERQGVRPENADFDDVVARLSRAGIAMQAMVTETPLWASTAPNPDPHKPESYKSAPPRGLHEPIFTDGTDQPGPGKQVNPANTWAYALEGMASRYRGRVRYWQVWNEPDYPNGDKEVDYTDARRSWNGSVDDYVRLLKVGHTIVKWIDPKAQVVTGGIGYADYLQAMLDRGAGAYFDQIDFHAYGWPGSEAALAKFLAVHDQMQAVLRRNGLGDKGLICSETGYTAQEPEVQAAYIAKLYPTAIALGMESTMYYANTNPSWKDMGLVDWRTMSQKTLGYWAYKNAAVALHDVRRVEPLRLGGAKGYRFSRANGSELLVLWAPGKARSVSVPLGRGSWQVRDDVGRLVRHLSGARASLALTDAPLYVDNDAARSYVAARPNPPLAYPGLAFTKAMADSSSENHGAPQAAIDLDGDTQWVNGAYMRPEAWLELGLRKASLVSSLKVKTGPTPMGTWFDVEVSQDGHTFHPVAMHQTVTSWNMETISLPQPTQAAYIRLHWHNPQQKPVSFTVFEVEAH